MVFYIISWVVWTIGVMAFEVTALHLLWLFPAGFVLGALSIAFPFSLLSIPGTAFGRVCCIGLTQQGGEQGGEHEGEQ